MPIITSPIGTLLIALAAIVALVLWLRRDRSYPGPRLLSDDDGIDYKRLEEAEREVQELERNQHPQEGLAGSDWPRRSPRPPERL
jgi:hypothetical protein